MSCLLFIVRILYFLMQTTKKTENIVHTTGEGKRNPSSTRCITYQFVKRNSYQGIYVAVVALGY